MIPSAIDAQEAVALKLLKRFFNLRYGGLLMKRPPSIYLTKRAGDVGYVPPGLTAQLFALADATAKIMRNHIASGTRPRELNPSYHLDRINEASVFDMIAGTSTGGIIALGLGLGKSAAEIAAFYHDDGRHIFPPLPPRRLMRWWKLWCALYGPKLNHEELERALKRRFEDYLLGESTCRLVIPAFMMPKTEIAVFKTDHHENFRNDHKTPIRKVARATSAAPTYLKGLEHQESGRIFIDGGVWANNPAMVALVDALSAYDITPDQVEVLSIGTGNAPFSLSKDKVMSGLVAWREAIKAAMFLTTDNATAQLKLLLGSKSCLRIEPIGDDAAIEMDDYDAAFARPPALAAADFAADRAAIAPFFAQTAPPRERHYSNLPGRD